MLKVPGQPANDRLWILLACALILFASLTPPTDAQERPLRVFASVSRIDAPTDRGPLMTPIVIYVTDQDGRRIPGAIVILTAPAFGASATFLGGATTLTLTTGADGSVTVPGLIPNQTLGLYLITFKAQYQGLEGTGSVRVTNIGPPPPPPTKLNKWLVAGATVGAVISLTLIGTGRIGRDPTPNPNKPTVITIGGVSVGP